VTSRSQVLSWQWEGPNRHGKLLGTKADAAARLKGLQHPLDGIEQGGDLAIMAAPGDPNSFREAALPRKNTLTRFQAALRPAQRSAARTRSESMRIVAATAAPGTGTSTGTAESISCTNDLPARTNGTAM